MLQYLEMNRFRKKAILIVLMLAVFLLFWRIWNNETDRGRALTVGNNRFSIEIADTDELRTKGLSGRESLAENEGMLFVFPGKGKYSFWMKDMRFPLDFLWITDDYVIDITENVAQPSENQTDLPFYASKVPVDKVLEINAGTVQKLGIKEGDKVFIE